MTAPIVDRRGRLHGGWVVTATVSTVVVCTVMFAAYTVFVGFSDMTDRLSRLGTGAIAAILGLALINYILRGIRWHHFSRCLSLQSHLPYDLLLYFAGFALTLTPGKMGELVRLWFLRIRYGYSLFRTLPLTIGDRFCDLIAVAALMMMSASYPILDSYALTVACAAAMAGLVLILFNGRFIKLSVEAVYDRLRLMPRLFARFRGMGRAYTQVTSTRAYAVALPLSVLGWVAEVQILYVTAAELGAPIDWAAACFIFTASTIIGAILLIPGGLGGSDVSMAGLLILAGVEFDTALAITLIVRAATLWFAAALGIMTIPIAAVASRKPAD
jgi:uncharacterized protein (TIRG00374 family)